MKAESNLDPQAVSPKGAIGLMQVMPQTAREFGVTNPADLKDPQTNIRVGLQYMSQLMDRYKGNVELSLAAYNAGPHRVKRWKKLPGSEHIDVFIENIEFYQTRDYVRKVMKNYWAYKLLQSNFQIGSEDLLLGSL